MALEAIKNDASVSAKIEALENDIGISNQNGLLIF